MDGGKFYNRIQSGSFQHRSMAAALRVQYGPGWTTSILNNMGIKSSICDKFTNRRKRKHDKDNARKVLLKYKKQRLMTRYGQPRLNSSANTSYGSDPAEPDISVDELKQLCQEYLARLQVGDKTYNITNHSTHRCPMRKYVRLVLEQSNREMTNQENGLCNVEGV